MHPSRASPGLARNYPSLVKSELRLPTPVSLSAAPLTKARVTTGNSLSDMLPSRALTSLYPSRSGIHNILSAQTRRFVMHNIRSVTRYTLHCMFVANSRHEDHRGCPWTIAGLNMSSQQHIPATSPGAGNTGAYRWRRFLSNSRPASPREGWDPVTMSSR